MAASTPDMTKMAEIMVNACISDDNYCPILTRCVPIFGSCPGSGWSGECPFSGVSGCGANPFLPQGGIDKNFGDRG